MRPVTVAGLLALIAAAFAAGWWLWPRPEPSRPIGAPATPPARARATPPSPPPPTIQPTPGHRLAGVALGERSEFAVFADPSGQTALYEIGDEIPDLGTLTEVSPGRAVVSGAHGTLEFRIQPASTPTPARITALPAETLPPPEPSPAHTARESRPSTEPDRPAS